MNQALSKLEQLNFSGLDLRLYADCEIKFRGDRMTCHHDNEGHVVAVDLYNDLIWDEITVPFSRLKEIDQVLIQNEVHKHLLDIGEIEDQNAGIAQTWNT